ncbi:MAG: S41 family peptidase [Thermodesulfobacteriota bacterium]
MHARRFFGLFLLLPVLFLILPRPASAEEPKTIPPLFPVALNHTFEKPKESFEEVKKLLLTKYYSDSLTEEALYWAAIEGMLRHVSPPDNPGLSQIWTADQYKAFVDALSGARVSLGLQCSFNPAEGSLTVSSVEDGSPSAGVLFPLDRILRIDDKPLKGLDVAAVGKLLEGEEGSDVTLTVNRDIKVFTITLRREKMPSADIASAMLDKTTGVVELRSFSAGVSGRMKEELKKLAREGCQRLILDLRGNGGGVLLEGLKSAEIFLPEKAVLLRTVENGSEVRNYVSSNKEPMDFAIVILTDRRTASAAEVMAAALRDHGKAYVVGARTFGKGVSEQTFTLQDGSIVKFIVNALYSPRGISWQGKGLAPDFLVETDEKTEAALLKMDIKARYQADVATITAHKLLLMQKDCSEAGAQPNG